MALGELIPIIVFVVYVIGGLARMMAKARENRLPPEEAEPDLPPLRRHQPMAPPTARSSATSTAGAPPPRPLSTAAPAVADRAPPAFPDEPRPLEKATLGPATIASPDDDTSFGDTSFERPSDEAIAPGLSAALAPPPAARKKQRSPQHPKTKGTVLRSGALSTRTRVRQLLSTRAGMADALLAAEVLGPPVSERH